MTEILKIPLISALDFSEHTKLEDYKDVIDVPKSQLLKHLHKREKPFALLIKDYTTKDALLLPDDIVIIIKSNQPPKEGDFVAIANSGKLEFGYLSKHQNGLTLKQIIPDAKPIFLKNSSRFSIIGRVVLIIRNNVNGNTTETISPPSRYHKKIISSLQDKRRNSFLRIFIFCILITSTIFILQQAFNASWPTWTGFHQKTLWDWLELLIIPAIISIGIFLLNQGQHSIAQRRLEENSQENILQQYLDKMTDLLLSDKFISSKDKTKHLHLARTRTLTILRKLDGERKGLIIRFLYETNLITGPDEEVEIQLIEGNLSESNLSYSYLSEINLNGTHLQKSNFQNSDISDAFLQSCFLYGANFSNAKMTGANLKSANLENADLSNADLRYANLLDTNINIKQIMKTKSFDGALLPRKIQEDLLLQKSK